jgi:hypothetical protein
VACPTNFNLKPRVSFRANE